MSVTFLAVCLAVTVLYAVAVAGARTSGTLEICKSAANGAAGQAFSFTATSGSGAVVTATVKGGTCSSPLSTPAGSYTVVEDLSSGLWGMAGAQVVPPSALLSENDSAGKVKVTVSANAETQVTVINAAASATVKVCKWSAASQLQGAQFSFTVNGQPVTAVAGKNAASAGCSAALTTQPGTRLKVQENIPANEQVTSVTFNGKPVTATGGLVKVTAATGANVVVFENEPVGPPQTGYVEVCKDAGDDYISRSDPFTFTITDKTGVADTEHVFAGQCTGPIKVAAGNVGIAETPTDGTFVKSITAFPNPNALGPTNLTNGTTTVVVPVSSDPSGEVQVHFVNSTQTATLKVCKVLTASSGALAGKTFQFDIASRSATSVDSLSIVASAGASGACKVFAVPLPVGSSATVTEEAMANVAADGKAVGTGDSQQVTIQPGINNVTFTNQAYGQLEICKHVVVNPADTEGEGGLPNYSGIVFHFSVDGSKTLVDVAAGHCSFPIAVTAGTHTVEEVNLPYGFQFVSSTATGPVGQSRGSGTNPITVTVPFFGAADGGETEVDFTNRVIRANVKVCKTIDPGSTTALGNLPFTFDVRANYGGGEQSNEVSTASPYPSCTGLTLDIPLVDSAGEPSTVAVTEQAGHGFTVSGITVDHVAPGTTPTVVTGSGGSVRFIPGPGTAVVTFTNMATTCTPIAYVTEYSNDADRSMLPIDTTNDSPLTELTGGDEPYEIAVTPDGKTAVIGNDGNGTVTFTDLTNGHTFTTGLIDGAPRGIAITPDGKTAYVAFNFGDDLVPIDVATHTVGTPINLGLGSAPWGVAITPDGKFAYVTLTGPKPGEVVKVDLATNAVVGSPIKVGNDPRGIAITPDGTRAYVANHADDTVSVIALTTGTVVQTVTLPAGSGPLEVAITPGGTLALVTDENTGHVTPIEIPSGIVEPDILVGSGFGEEPHGLAITPDGTKAYVAVPHGEGTYVAVIDLALREWVNSVDVPDPNYVAIGCGGSFDLTRLAITKDDNTGRAPPCFNTYTIVVTNEGSVDATGVSVVDNPVHGFVPSGSPNLPPGVQFDLASLTWTIGTIPAGQSVTLTIEGGIPDRTSVTNVATVSAGNAATASAEDVDQQPPPVYPCT
jgi:YVTN family beta-propeller protein